MLVSWLATYPTITGILMLIGPFTIDRLPLPILTAIMTVVAVPMITFVLLPFLLRYMGGWVGLPPAPQPPRWKLALLNWLGIYPLITLILLIVGPFLFGVIPIPLLTLIITLVLVPLMSYVVMPFLRRRFAGWLTS